MASLRLQPTSEDDDFHRLMNSLASTNMFEFVDQLLNYVSPTVESDQFRKSIVAYIAWLTAYSQPINKTFLFGSVATGTYVSD